MRLFIGVPVGGDAGDALERTAMRMRELAGRRYAAKELYHITLAFLGEVNEERLGDVRDVMNTACAKAVRTRLTLSRPGYFGKREHAILYCGVEGAEPLQGVSDELKRQLGAHGLPFDPKPFRAHITLARQVNATRALLETPVDHVGFQAEGLTLLHSCRVDGVLRYLPIYTAKFSW